MSIFQHFVWEKNLYSLRLMVTNILLAALLSTCWMMRTENKRLFDLIIHNFYWLAKPFIKLKISCQDFKMNEIMYFVCSLLIR